MKENNNQLKHYTSVNTLYKILANGFMFQDGKSWDDDNDRYTLQMYRDYISPKNVLALCFCNGSGNAYHWTALGKIDPDDLYSKIKCSIVLNKDTFLKYIGSIDGISHRAMMYCKNKEVLEHQMGEHPLFEKEGIFCRERVSSDLYGRQI